MSIAACRKRVVILVLVHKPTMTPDEALSFEQCLSILGAHDIVLVCPSGMEVSAYRKFSTWINFYKIDPWWQNTYDNFNRLKISPLLYWKFRRYDYILFYELDAFVFRDELDMWCQAGYDYIGAPWFHGFNTSSNESLFLGVGNGGFSLRRTRAALRVLRSFSYIRKPRELLRRPVDFPKVSPDVLARQPPIPKWRFGYLMAAAARNLAFGNNTFYLLNDFSGHEDLFWGLIAPKNFSWFKVAPVDEARRFSFECNPRKLFELNENQLPFGCHAWQKYDPEFWALYITPDAKMDGNCDLPTGKRERPSFPAAGRSSGPPQCRQNSPQRPR
jgi:hypothetical protein